MENLVMGGKWILVLNKYGGGGIISIQNRDQWRIILNMAPDHRLL